MFAPVQAKRNFDPSSGPNENPNHEREAYKKAYAAWCASSLRDKASCHSYNVTRKLFISHELLKAGYTISNELYNEYCWRYHPLVPTKIPCTRQAIK